MTVYLILITINSDLEGAFLILGGRWKVGNKAGCEGEHLATVDAEVLVFPGELLGFKGGFSCSNPCYLVELDYCVHGYEQRYSCCGSNHKQSHQSSV